MSIPEHDISPNPPGDAPSPHDDVREHVSDADAPRAEVRAQVVIENVIESIADPFYALDKDWRFLYVNGVAQQMWGKPREALIGQNIWEAFPSGKGTQGYVEMHRAVEEQHPIVFETYSAFLERWVEVNLYPSENGLAVYFRDVNARVQAEEALRKSESRLQAVFNQAGIGISLIQEDGHFIQVNPGFSEILGYSQDEVTSMTVKDITLPEDYESEQILLEEVLTGKRGSYILEKRYIRKDGQPIWVKLIRSRVREEDTNRVYALALVEDINAQKIAQEAARTAEAALTAEQQRIITIFESISDAFTALDEEYRYTYLNPQGAELTLKLSGLTIDQLIGQTLWEAFPGSENSPFGESYRRVMATGVSEQFQAHFPPLGALFDVRVYRSKEGLSIYFVDVTERQQARAALREAEERLRLMIDSAKDYAILALDPDGYIASWNSGAERMFGHIEADILAKPAALLYTEEDRAAGVVQDEIRRAHDLGVAEDRRWHLRKDGSRFYASGMMRPIYDEAGLLQGYTKVARDTTEQHLAEQRTQLLQQLAGELSAQLTRQEMANSIARMTYQWAGPALCRVFMLTEDGLALRQLAMDSALHLPPTADLLPMEDAYTITDAVRSGEVIWVGSQEEYITRYPHLRDAIVNGGIQATISLPMRVHSSVVGGIGISFQTPRSLSPADRDMLVAISHLSGQALQRARLFEAEQAAQRHASLRAERLTLLQSVTSKLSGLMTTEQVSRAVVDEGVLTLGAATGSINLLEDEDTFVVVYSTSQKILSTEREKWQRFKLDPRLPVGEAVLQRAPVWIENAQERLSQDADLAPIADVYPGAWVLLPMMADDHPIGVLGFAYKDVRKFDDEERQFMIALAQQCAQALERARLYEAERVARVRAEQAAGRIALLQSLTAGLSEAVTVQQVAHVCLTQSMPVIGAQMGNVVLLSEDGQWLETVENQGVAEEAAARFQRISIDAVLPMCDAVRSKAPVWVRTVDEFATQYPSVVEETTAALNSQSFANLPLIIEDRVIGAIGFAFTSPNAFVASDRAFMLALAQQCAQAIERAQLYENEMRARQEAEKANTIKMHFLGMISHELRTPLASIKGFTSTLLAEDVTFPPEQQREFLQIMDEESDRLTALVEQLLDLSRLQAGTLRIDPKAQPVQAIVSLARTQLETLTKQHRLRIQIPETLPAVIADTERIAQVLVNLVGNGAKFSPMYSRIDVKASKQGRFVQIDVSDEGQGIPPEERLNVFEAFRQVERKNPNQRLGAGLGLAICKGIIDAHGGRIWIQDQVSGTTISFTLPAVQQKR